MRELVTEPDWPSRALGVLADGHWQMWTGPLSTRSHNITSLSLAGAADKKTCVCTCECTAQLLPGCCDFCIPVVAAVVTSACECQKIDQ